MNMLPFNVMQLLKLTFMIFPQSYPKVAYSQTSCQALFSVRKACCSSKVQLCVFLARMALVKWGNESSNWPNRPLRRFVFRPNLYEGSFNHDSLLFVFTCCFRMIGCVCFLQTNLPIESHAHMQIFVLVVSTQACTAGILKSKSI